MRSLISTAPESHPGRAAGPQRAPSARAGLIFRPGTKRDVTSLTKLTLWTLARRAIALEEEITEIDSIIKPRCNESASELVATLGVGAEAASALLVAAGDNADRLHNEAAFAHLCGTSPLDAERQETTTSTQPRR